MVRSWLDLMIFKVFFNLNDCMICTGWVQNSIFCVILYNDMLLYKGEEACLEDRMN